MCYFLTVGAVTEPWRLTSLLEEQLQPEVEAAVPPGVSAAFPPEQAVRVLVSRGCSCMLIEPAARLPAGIPPTAGAVWLTPGGRRALVSLANRLGYIRLCIHRRRGLSVGPHRVSMTVDQLVDKRTGLPVETLIDITRGPASRSS